MARMIRIGVGVAVILGLLWYLQSRVAEQPQTVIEKPVDVNALK